MIYIATNCDEKFYRQKPNNILESLLKYKKYEIMFFQIGFDETIEGVINVSVPPDKIKHSLRKDTLTRKNYVCLESGEFVNFYNFNDEDILILLDYDIIQQRSFSDDEIFLINTLKDDEFYLTKNEFTGERDSNSEMDIVCFDKSVMSGKEPFTVYNAGCQIANIKTWKKLYQEWVKIYNEWEEKCKHHATGQLIINYILHKEDMIRELSPSFHSAWFMHGLKHYNIDNKFHVSDGDKMVLFNHHAWHSDFV